MLLRGAQTKSAYPRCSSISSALAALDRARKKDGQRFTHLQSTVHTNLGRKNFPRRVTTIFEDTRRRAGCVPAILPNFWQLFSQSSRVRGKCRPVCVRTTWRLLVTVGTKQQWSPRLVEVHCEVRQFGVKVPGGGEGRGAGHKRCASEVAGALSPTLSNVLEAVNRTAVPVEMANRMPALTLLEVRRNDARPASVLFLVDSGETWTIAYFIGYNKRILYGAAMFCLYFAVGAEPFPRGRRRGSLRLLHERHISEPYGGRRKRGRSHYYHPQARAERNRRLDQRCQDRGTTPPYLPLTRRQESFSSGNFRRPHRRRRKGAAGGGRPGRHRGVRR